MLFHFGVKATPAAYLFNCPAYIIVFSGLFSYFPEFIFWYNVIFGHFARSCISLTTFGLAYGLLFCQSNFLVFSVYLLAASFIYFLIVDDEESLSLFKFISFFLAFICYWLTICSIPIVNHYLRDGVLRYLLWIEATRQCPVPPFWEQQTSPAVSEYFSEAELRGLIDY